MLQIPLEETKIYQDKLCNSISMQRHMAFPPLHLKEIFIKNQQQERCEKFQVSIPRIIFWFILYEQPLLKGISIRKCLWHPLENKIPLGKITGKKLPGYCCIKNSLKTPVEGEAAPVSSPRKSACTGQI